MRRWITALALVTYAIGLTVAAVDSLAWRLLFVSLVGFAATVASILIEEKA